MPDTVALPALPPAAAVDIEGIRAAAAGLVPLRGPVADSGEETTRAWRQVGYHYHAPETPVLLGALDKIPDLADAAGQRVVGVGTALEVFADMAEPVIQELRRLAAAGRGTPADAARMTALIAELAACEQACAAALRSVVAASLEPDRIKVAEEVGKREGGGLLGLVTLAGGATLKVTTASDGSVIVTALDAGGVGLAGSAGGLVDLGGGVTVESGSAWRFQDAAEADRMIGELLRYVEQRQRPVTAGKGAFPAAALLRPPRPPDLVSSEVGAQASVTARYDGKGLYGAAQAAGVLKETVVRDRATGSTNSVLAVQGTLAADGSVRPGPVGSQVGGGAKGTVELTREVTRDASGRITEVQLTETVTRPGPGGPAVGAHGTGPTPGGRPGTGIVTQEHRESTARVTTTTLEVNDRNRAVVDDWVARGRPDIGTPAGQAKLHRPDTEVPGDRFQNLLHDEAKVSEATYAERSGKLGAEGELRGGGVAVGGKIADEETSSRAVQASHLGAAGEDGVRRPVPDPEQIGR